MFSKKYTKDYKLDYRLAENGKMKAVAKYAGKKYAFVLSGKERVSSLKRLFLFSVVMWASYLVPLFFDSFSARRPYVIFPHAFCFFPMIYVCLALYGAVFFKEPLTRQQRDNTEERIAKSSFILLILSSIALLADAVVFVIFTEELNIPFDIIYIVCVLFLFLSSLAIFMSRKALETRSLDD